MENTQHDSNWYKTHLLLNTDLLEKTHTC